MTYSNKKPTASNAPSHVAYMVRDAKGGKSFWTRIGAAWQHEDGNGFNVQLDAMPFDGRLVLRTVAESKD